ncbi:MAG: hypothetical protein ACWA5A_05795 [Marinibacterium sp.]
MSDTAKAMKAGDLARLRSCVSGCELVVLADISTKTVLAWEGALKLPQEYLDSLCDLAGDIFAGQADDLSDQSSESPTQTPSGTSPSEVPDTAILAQPTGTRTFVRSPEDQGEVLCCVLAAEADPQAAIAASVAFFEPGGRGGTATVH